MSTNTVYNISHDLLTQIIHYHSFFLTLHIYIFTFVTPYDYSRNHLISNCRVKFMWLKIIIIFVCVVCFDVDAQTPITIGNQFTLASKTLNEDRRISVYLPRSYERSPKATYDVLYLLDGGVNLLHTAGNQYFLAGYRQMPELIIIGIHNTDRDRDFTPSSINKTPNSAGADNFRLFIQKELFPLIDSKFRTGKKTLPVRSFLRWFIRH